MHNPEDLEPDSLGGEAEAPPVDFAEEEVVSERIVTPGPLKLSADLPRAEAALGLRCQLSRDTTATADLMN